ncbi:nuclease [Neotabrizicola sp. sgz301269]|uniref:nuclease n=1 Tax=Neotabrizicola sp. sgz301269 TaxID=3276282 RepID=UPI00376FC87E
MAKRKRLTLSDQAPLTRFPALPREEAAELGAMRPFGVAAAPISRETQDAAAVSALQELADEIDLARSDGRLAQQLPLQEIDEGWLVRDRLTVDADELAALRQSLQAHGQRMAIEVVDHGPGIRPRYGLISGWRRLTALRDLHRDSGEPRFATVLAVLRHPETAGDAYVAMVEENEIRAGLSYYERARIAAKAVEAGVFATPKQALQRLYAQASRARRSKIGSFLTLHEALGEALRFPAAIPERLGLALAMRIGEAPGFAAEVAARLDAEPPSDAAAEQALLSRALRGSGRPAPATIPIKDVLPGLSLQFRSGELRLTGKAVDAALRDRLAAWLRGQAG